MILDREHEHHHKLHHEFEKRHFDVRHDIERRGHRMEREVERRGYENALLTEKKGNENALLTEKSTYELKALIDKSKAATKLARKENEIDLLKTKNDLEKQAAVNATMMQMALADVKLDSTKNTALVLEKVTKSKCGLEKQVADTFRDLQLDSYKNRDMLQLEAYKNRDLILKSVTDLQLEAYKNRDQMQLEAYKNRDLILKNMSDNCCDLKQELAEKTFKLEKMIENLDAEKYKFQLNEANNENLILRLNREYRDKHH